MSPRPRVLLPLVLLAAAPLAAAHGEDAPAGTGPFDPLRLQLHTWLDAEGGLAMDGAPAAASVPFAPPAPGAATSPPLSFSLAMPVTATPGGPIEVELHLRADKAVVARDADGNAFEVSLLQEGAPIDGATKRVALADPVLAPGSTPRVVLTLQAPGALLLEGEALTLVVAPLMAGLQEGALSLLVGGERASTLDMRDLRVPALAHLRLQEAPLREFLLDDEDFRPPPGAVANVLRVGHDRIDGPATVASARGGTYLVLRGEEGPEVAHRAHAHASRDARVAAAHELLVGDTPVRVHPGVGVVVQLPANATTTVTCARHCPAGGFSMTFATGDDADADAAARAPQSSLIPPPRDTRGVPVSEDAPETRGVPAPAPLAALAVMAVAAMLARRRLPKR